MRITQELVEHGEVRKQKFADWLGIEVIAEQSLLEPYANRLAAFESQLKLMDKLVVMRPSLEIETIGS